MSYRFVTGLLFASLTAFAAPEAKVADAVKRDDKTALRALLQQKADVNIPLADGSTALHWAVEGDDVQTLDLLIQAGANVKAKDRYGLTPLYYACTNGNTAIVQRLLKSGADANDADKNNDTVLMIASRGGNTEILKALLDAGAAVNAKDTAAQETALMWAAREERLAAVRMLLEHGADVNAVTRAGKQPARRPPGAGGGSHGTGIVRGGWPDRGYQAETPGGLTALLYSAREGGLEITKALVAAKADINKPDVNGISPLMMAITNAHLDIAKFLVEQGADMKAADAWGRTPLWATVEIRNLELGRSGVQTTNRDAALELIKTLLERGVDVNARTKEVPPVRRFVMPLGDLSWVDFTGQTPFLRAAISGDITVMKLLLAKGADPNIPTNSNTTALMAAAGVNWVINQTYVESKEHLMESLKLCFELGGDVNAKNSMGLTPVMGAANRGSDEMIEWLVSKGARLDVKDNEGRSPYNWAEGVFLATNAPEAKPSSMALIKKLLGDYGK